MYLILRFWSLSGVLPFLASSCTVSGGGAVNLRSCKSPFLANFTKTHSEIFDLYPELPTYQPTMSDLSKIVLIVTVYPIFTSNDEVVPIPEVKAAPEVIIDLD